MSIFVAEIVEFGVVIDVRVNRRLSRDVPVPFASCI